MEIKIDLNEPKILEKVTNDEFGMNVSTAWKSLLQPYEPRDTNTMSSTAKIYPFKIHYIQKDYPAKVYFDSTLNFQKKNPYSTYEWDIKAAQSGQLNKLYRTLNNGLQSGKF